jgi:hypothetical protein
MDTRKFVGRSGVLAAALAAVLTTAGPASASTTLTPTAVAPLKSCAAPTATQRFLSFGDADFYAFAPGGSFDPGNGWTVANGASVTSTTQYNGARGGVHDLPSGSPATSPPMCVTSDYPTVQYYVNGSWTSPKDTGQFHGDGNAWTLTRPINILPSNVAGWQQVRFTFFAGGTNSRFQVDEFWVDPRASR